MICVRQGRWNAWVVARAQPGGRKGNTLAMALASEAGELRAEYRWVANAEADAFTKAPDRKSKIAAEAADVGIALLLFCDRIGVDLLEVIREKLKVNRRNYPVEESRGRGERRK